jgi:hypothetical protein
MKAKIFFTATLLTISILSVQAQSSDMFERLSNIEGVTSVYISRALLGMMPNFDAGGANIGSLAGRLEQIEIHNSNGNAEANRIIINGVESLVNSGRYELLMRVRSEGNNIVFYAHRQGEYFRDLIMHINQSNGHTLIRFMGTFTAEDIQGVMDGM